jgi:tetratricopeptide (TPR) repeat protein
MPERPAEEEFIRLLERRVDLLQCLESSSHRKPEIVEALEWSRSTVDRAIRELELENLVERTDEGYTTTLAGRLVTTQYSQFVETIGDVLVASPLLESLPRDSPITPEDVVGIERVSTDDLTSFEIPSILRNSVESADVLTAAIPVVADPLLLGLCHSEVMNEELELDLVVGPDLHETLQQRFPGTLRDLVDSGSTLMRAERSPPCAVLFVERESDEYETVVVAYEEDTRSGIFRNDTDAALDKATDYLTGVTESATDITDEAMGLSSDAQQRLSISGRLPSSLSSSSPFSSSLSSSLSPTAVLEQEGFIELTSAYFESHSPGKPVTSWRTGIDLAEVAAGYAAERTYERDGERQSIVDDLVTGLREGSDHALVGLPGSGKSTVCKMVAYRWYEAGYGTVFYHKHGTGRTFSNTDALRACLSERDDFTLVVVEDALSEAAAIFRVVADYRDDPSVTFLVESREHEWDNPTVSSLDTNIDAYRTEAIKRVRMPTLDVTECERLVRQFETMTGQRVDIDVADVLDGPGQDSDPAALLVVLHRLAADPLASFESTIPTTLTEDVLQTYDDLRAIGDHALDVGVLVSLLNATDIGVHPGFVRSLAEDDGNADDAIEDALSLLEGRVIFERNEPNEEASPYRAVHKSWSVLFLQQLLNHADETENEHTSDHDNDHERDHDNNHDHEREVEQSAERRFGRVVTSLLSLADDETRRARIDWEFGGNSPAIKEISNDPQEWVDATVERIFSLGLERSALAPLFGASTDSRIDLPTACSTEIETSCTEWRGKMSLYAGCFDTAVSEFEHLGTLADELEDETLYAQSLKYRGAVAYRQSEFDDAESFHRRSRTAYRTAGDKLGEADAINNLGMVAWSRGNLDEAEMYLQESLERYREIGNDSGETAARFNLATVLDSKGDLACAAEQYETCLDYYRSTGDCHSEADTLNNLGVLKRKRGELDAAERCLAQAFDTYHDIGDEIGEANSLHTLGHISQLRGEFERAIEYHERSLERYRDVGDTQGVAQCLGNRADIYRRQGDLDSARQRYKRSLDLRRDIGDHLGIAESLVNLGRVARLSGDLDTAMDHAECSLDSYRARGDVRGETDCLRLLGKIAYEQEAFETADDRLTESLERARESVNPLGEARTLVEQGVLAEERDNHKHARERYETALSTFCDIGATRNVVETYHHLAAVCVPLDDSESAFDHYKKAIELADENGFDVEEITTRMRRDNQ